MDGIYKQEDGTILIEYKGQRGKLSDWAQWRGISKTTLYVRVRAGWPVEEILRRKRFHGNPEEDGAGLQSLCWDCKHAVPTGAGNRMQLEPIVPTGRGMGGGENPSGRAQHLLPCQAVPEV